MAGHVDAVVSVFPIVLLIYLMTKKNSLASHVALPLVALLTYFLTLVFFKANPNIINATVVSGLLTAWTPILIIWGAVFLFKTMEYSGAMDVLRRWLNGITPNRVAQVMIVGWAFGFLVEGTSGFGTPAALAAPILVGLGFAPVSVAVVCLIFNSVPVSFGAMGVPTWFGLSQIGLTSAQILEIGFKTAILHTAASLVIPVLALFFIFDWNQIRRNLGFVYISILACVIPYILLARFNYEFPSFVGGTIGLLLSVYVAKRGIGLAREVNVPLKDSGISTAQLVKAAFPLWATFIILLITRNEQLGIKAILNSDKIFFKMPLGSLGEFSLTPALTVKLSDIFGTDCFWDHKLLYVPSLIPFFLVSAISFFVLKMNKAAVALTWNDSFGRMKQPIIALCGALVFVKLLMAGAEQSCAMTIGKSLAAVTGSNWQYFASYLGSIGAFFAGSNTVSNLTFGGIQNSIALNLGLNQTTVLSLQSAGGAMGNMFCINNIVAVCSVLGIVNQEGYIIKRTIWPMIIYGVIVGAIACFL